MHALERQEYWDGHEDAWVLQVFRCDKSLLFSGPLFLCSSFISCLTLRGTRSQWLLSKALRSLLQAGNIKLKPQRFCFFMMLCLEGCRPTGWRLSTKCKENFRNLEVNKGFLNEHSKKMFFETHQNINIFSNLSIAKLKFHTKHAAPEVSLLTSGEITCH